MYKRKKNVYLRDTKVLDILMYILSADIYFDFFYFFYFFFFRSNVQRLSCELHSTLSARGSEILVLLLFLMLLSVSS